MSYKNPQDAKVYAKRYREINKEKLRDYYFKNREKILAQYKVWREKKLGRPKTREWKNIVIPSMTKPSFEFGYVLGALTGDGSIHVKRPMGRASLSVTDRDFAEYFRYMVKNIYPYNISFTKRKNGTSKKDFYVVNINSYYYCKFLKEFDLNSFLDSSTDMKRGFLKGMFDSEGCVTAWKIENPKIAMKNISFTQTDKNVMDLVSNLLFSLGIGNKINSRFGSGFMGKDYKSYVLYIHRYENLKRFRDLVGFSIKRKLDKLDLILSYFIIENDCRVCGQKFRVRSPTHKTCDNCIEGYLNRYHENYREEKRIKGALLCH